MALNIRQKQTGVQTARNSCPDLMHRQSYLDQCIELHANFLYLIVCLCVRSHAEVLIKALQIASTSNGTSSVSRDPGGEVYKILILDRFSKDVIAPLLRVNDLRNQGVTLHLMLEADRQAIADVPAVYLVQPTAANIDRIISDAAQGLYSTVHVHFTSSVPGRLIEQLAAGVVKAGALSCMGKVFDQYLSFIALEPTLFSLGQPEAYVELNDPAARDTQIEVS